MVLPKLEETKHSELIEAQTAASPTEWRHIAPAEMETKHSEPIVRALPIEVPYQQCTRVIPNPFLRT
jgi:hypothetical protein